jgi:hypothetical protein
MAKPDLKRERRRALIRRHHHRTELDQVLTKNGSPVAIMRPLNPELALRLVAEIPNGTQHEEAQRRFEEIFHVQPYCFMGLAARPNGDGKIYLLDPRTGKRIGTVQPGDSFVDYEAMQRYGERIDPPV